MLTLQTAMNYLSNIETWVESLLRDAGIAEEWVIYVRLIFFLFVLCIGALLAFFITKRLIIHYIYKAFKKTSFTWDDLIADNKAFDNLAHIAPALIVRITAPVFFADFQSTIPVVIKLTDAYLIVVSMLVFFALTKVGEYVLAKHPVFKDKPLASYFQLIRILLYIVTLILVLSVLLDKSPVYLLSAFGAMTAVLLLVFKDTILGLVASVQMSANDMVRVGDWVEMPKFNADGDVIEINLNTVKVQNWDKTITNIPTYYFITDSFKNWRGMVQSGGRRIKRALYLNTQKVKFADQQLLGRLSKIHLLSDFIRERQREIDAYNIETGVDTSVLINGRRMTNLGLFRVYVDFYLKNHPRLRKDMTIMVRQLSYENRGIPLEIYCFTNTTKWLEYESIQADIFDHLYAAVSWFDLEIFQEPAGTDFRYLVESRIRNENGDAPQN